MNSFSKSTLTSVALVAALTPFRVSAFDLNSPQTKDVLVAFVTLKEGMHPSKKAEYEPALTAACGDLGTAAKSQDVNVKVVGGWSDDQYANQVDPKATPKKYGNHLTVETFKSAERTGRWHLYESGSVWVDRKGDGNNISESCHS